jgi:hypothetical protein
MIGRQINLTTSENKGLAVASSCLIAKTVKNKKKIYLDFIRMISAESEICRVEKQRSFAAQEKRKKERGLHRREKHA